MSSISRAIFALLLGLLPVSNAFAINNWVFIVDGSGSMNQQFEGRPKLDTAKQELLNHLQTLEVGTNAGLIVYGGAGRCNGIRVVFPLAKIDKKELKSRISAIKGSGYSPIAKSLELAADQLKHANGDKAIFLLTDGEENCGGNPLEVAKKIRERNISLYIVGLNIPEVEATKRLKHLAEVGNGAYIGTTTAEGVRDAVGKVTEAAKTGKKTVAYTKVQENIQIILDRSASMGDKYRGSTRLDIAKSSLAKILRLQRPDRDNLAFRRFGEDCGAHSKTPTIDFGLNQGSEITQEAARLTPEGKRTLVDATLAAIDNFVADEKKRFDGVNRKVVLITGGIDSCQRHQGRQIISNRMARGRITPNIHFIAIGVSQNERREILELAEAAGNPDNVKFVETADQLDKALREIVEVEPAIRSVHAIAEVLSASTSQLNTALNFLNKDDFSSARVAIQEADRIRKDTLIPYNDLARRKLNEHYERVFSLSQAMREQQGKMFEHVLKGIATKEKKDANGHSEAHREYEAAVANWNQLDQELNLVVQRLRQ